MAGFSRSTGTSNTGTISPPTTSAISCFWISSVFHLQVMWVIKIAYILTLVQNVRRTTVVKLILTTLPASVRHFLDVQRKRNDKDKKKKEPHVGTSHRRPYLLQNNSLLLPLNWRLPPDSVAQYSKLYLLYFNISPRFSTANSAAILLASTWPPGSCTSNTVWSFKTNSYFWKKISFLLFLTF